MSNGNNVGEKMHSGSYVQAGSSLAEFVRCLDNFTPTIPDAVAQHLMEKNGISSADPRVLRLITIAAQKLISDIALDAMQKAKMTLQGKVEKDTKEVRYVLTSEILDPILKEYGITD